MKTILSPISGNGHRETARIGCATCVSPQNWWEWTSCYVLQTKTNKCMAHEHLAYFPARFSRIPVLKNPHLFNKLSKLFRDVQFWSAQTQSSVETLFLSERTNTQLFKTPKIFEIDALFMKLEGFLYRSQVLEAFHAYLKHTWSRLCKCQAFRILEGVWTGIPLPNLRIEPVGGFFVLKRK